MAMVIDMSAVSAISVIIVMSPTTVDLRARLVSLSIQ